jgi:hypothetical protein
MLLRLSIALLVGVAAAQQSVPSQLRGDLSGVVVRHSDDSAVVGARLNLSGKALRRREVTAADGSFCFPLLPPGPYRLQIAEQESKISHELNVYVRLKREVVVRIEIARKGAAAKRKAAEERGGCAELPAVTPYSVPVPIHWTRKDVAPVDLDKDPAQWIYQRSFSRRNSGNRPYSFGSFPTFHTNNPAICSLSFQTACP